MCAAIGTALFERLVPGGIPLTETTYSSGSDADCDYRTANGGQVGSNSYGSLHVRLLRYGRVGWYSGSDRASHALAESCDGTGASGRFHGVPGLGDESCSAFEDEGADRTGRGSAIVRRGADLFWVDYYTHPGTGDQAERAVTEVALASLCWNPVARQSRLRNYRRDAFAIWTIGAVAELRLTGERRTELVALLGDDGRLRAEFPVVADYLSTAPMLAGTGDERLDAASAAVA